MEQKAERKRAISEMLYHKYKKTIDVLCIQTRARIDIYRERKCGQRNVSLRSVLHIMRRRRRRRGGNAFDHYIPS